MLLVEVGEAIINEREKDLLRFQESRRRFAKAFSGDGVRHRRSDLLLSQLHLLLKDFRKAGKLGSDEEYKAFCRFIKQVKRNNLIPEDLSKVLDHNRTKALQKQERRENICVGIALFGVCVMLAHPLFANLLGYALK